MVRPLFTSVSTWLCAWETCDGVPRLAADWSAVCCGRVACSKPPVESSVAIELGTRPVTGRLPTQGELHSRHPARARSSSAGGPDDFAPPRYSLPRAPDCSPRSLGSTL